MSKLIKTRYKIIRPGGKDAIEGTVEWPREPGLDRIKVVLEAVFGKDYTEHVSVLADYDNGTNYQPLNMFVDENGLMKGLPRNEEATTLYRRATMLGRSGVPTPKDPEQLNFIVGPAVLFDRRVWF